MFKFLHGVYNYRQLLPAAGLTGLAVSFFRDGYHMPHAVGLLIIAIGLCFKMNISRILSIGIFGFFFTLPIFLFFLGKEYSFGDISAKSSIYQITFNIILLNVIPGTFILLLWKPFKRT